MEKSVLIEKRDLYLKVKAELLAKDYSDEIEEQVKNFRSQLTNEYETRRAQDVAKCDCYLHVVDECLTEIAEREATQETHATNIDESVGTAE